MGTGVIDCVCLPDGPVLAGDVSGRLVLYDADLEPLWERQEDMPVWGVGADGDVAAVALADKAGGKGAALVLDMADGAVRQRVDLPDPAWDALVDGDGAEKRAYVSTWGSGVVVLDTDDADASPDVIGLPGHVFGLDVLDGGGGRRLLTATVSQLGVVGVDLAEPGQALHLLRSDSACYKHAFGEDGEHLLVGSSSPSFIHGVRAPGEPLRYRTSLGRSQMDDVCATLVANDLAILGSLSGDIHVARLNRLSIDISSSTVGGGCWSFRKDPQRSSVWIARGDGFLAEYDLAELAQPAPSDDRKYKAPYWIEGSPRVFISYAHEDYDAARDLYAFLSGVGCRPWLDKVDLLAGQNWRYEIEREIPRADFFLLLLSPHSVSKRGFVQREVRLAKDVLDQLPESQIFLIPALLDECEVPPEIASRHWVDLRQEDGPLRLCQAIEAGRSMID